MNEERVGSKLSNTRRTDRGARGITSAGWVNISKRCRLANFSKVAEFPPRNRAKMKGFDEPPPISLEAILVSSASTFDLTHPLFPGTPIFNASWHLPVIFEQLGSIQSVGRRTTQLHFGSHAGTHIDAPSHFVPEGRSISDFDTSKFFGRALVVDLRDSSPGEKLTPDRIQPHLSRFQAGDILLLNFGWGVRFDKPSYYPDQPFLSLETGQLIADAKPKMLGYDMAMPDNPAEGFGSECDSPLHKLFLQKEILLVENLLFPQDLPGAVNFIALPLKLDGIDGSPVRAVAYV